MRTKTKMMTVIFMGSTPATHADTISGYSDNEISAILLGLLMGMVVFILLLLSLWLYRLVTRLRSETRERDPDFQNWCEQQLTGLDQAEIDHLIARHDIRQKKTGGKSKFILLMIVIITTTKAHAQITPADAGLMKSPGMIIMLTLILIPLLLALWLTGIKISRIIARAQYRRIKKDISDLTNTAFADPEFYRKLIERKAALDFRLADSELRGREPVADTRGMLHNVSEVHSPRFLSSKRKALLPHELPPGTVKLILWYLASATVWLIIGTSIGEYLGIKFVSPDADHISWLSFGRLRPVHTNMVFWGWSSLAMIGLGYYVVPKVGNSHIFNLRIAYWSLIAINTAIICGTVSLMAGINNGGGEYREYTWPVMSLFTAGILLSLYNYFQTIGSRSTKEIYISNWYIVSAMMFIAIIAIVGYVPWWQNGLGETIVQGYYMHQAVGMWFMLFNLGLIYYFLPQQLNTPIYSYSLGILAFWAQILFYTLIGTHHFLFSSIPWWLQTIAIVGSVGMLIPVFAGTTNFLMTMRGNFNKIGRSYTLPFYLVGILFYFTGSTQGTAEAFRETNLVWHFTDFTTAHSHLTMYGIIAFLLWASIYTLVPRLTGKEPAQHWVGAHFWLALLGLLFYTIPLMIGGTLRGMAWQTGRPFIESVTLMAPYWLWRAIGGTLMWLSHLIFCWNMYSMTLRKTESEIRRKVLDAIDDSINITTAI
ncbi:cbb3-type cytochrome c oxidase subunit I [Mucilaginibacter endophyticus]|uniref:cbb3-type cytochrome c oxidase subunit I n=1 Tax=Mucilaginibacter endophyticus TaxID=2675003 RepID=UPI001FC99F8D|nr:cbb3-type cytochrome c oxidase subunit I [Mucilaginibacter endophyticus]